MAGDLVDANGWLNGLKQQSALTVLSALRVRLTACLKPTQLPATLRGTLITNQIPRITSMVVNGTAPLDRLAHRNRLSRKKVAKTIPGIMIGVMAIFRFHLSPPNDL